ncbi:hypothetical protein C8R44DRAFT_890664 [Mycena epipterygia]|nr:hypothetical protein C8R44DRAFT_890664 [Mycena epipterygia]
MRPPPLVSKHSTGPTEFELRAQRAAVRREKARVRMARKRAELKSRPIEEQMAAAERERGYQATYQERNREDLKIWERQRRIAVYQAKYGQEAYIAYAKAKRDRKRRAQDKLRRQRTIMMGVATQREVTHAPSRALRVQTPSVR